MSEIDVAGHRLYSGLPESRQPAPPDPDWEPLEQHDGGGGKTS